MRPTELSRLLPSCLVRGPQVQQNERPITGAHVHDARAPSLHRGSRGRAPTPNKYWPVSLPSVGLTILGKARAPCQAFLENLLMLSLTLPWLYHEKRVQNVCSQNPPTLSVSTEVTK